MVQDVSVSSCVWVYLEYAVYSSSDNFIYIYVCTISLAQAAAHKRPKLLPSTAQQPVSQVHHDASSGCPKAVEHWNLGAIEKDACPQNDIPTRLLDSLPRLLLL